MNLQPIRKYRRRLDLTSGIIKNNPVLGMGLALPFVVIASTSLKRGAVMSIIMLFATVPTVFAAYFLRKVLPRWLRLPVYCLVSISCIALLMQPLGKYPVLLDDLGVYVPLAAVNMMMVELTLSMKKKPLFPAVKEAVFLCIGFALVMCAFSAIREVMSAHTLWDLPLNIPTVSISGAALPCFGFILLGFFAAFARAVDRSRVRVMLRRGESQASAEEETV